MFAELSRLLAVRAFLTLGPWWLKRSQPGPQEKRSFSISTSSLSSSSCSESKCSSRSKLGGAYYADGLQQVNAWDIQNPSRLREPDGFRGLGLVKVSALWILWRCLLHKHFQNLEALLRTNMFALADPSTSSLHQAPFLQPWCPDQRAFSTQHSRALGSQGGRATICAILSHVFPNDSTRRNEVWILDMIKLDQTICYLFWIVTFITFVTTRLETRKRPCRSLARAKGAVSILGSLAEARESRQDVMFEIYIYTHV